MTTSRDGDQGLLHDYLGKEPLPTDVRVIKTELERVFAVAEMEVGWMNHTHAGPSSRLNEQPRIYTLPLFRWALKAIRQRNAGFFIRLAKSLAAAEFCAPCTKVPRELIQAASTRSRELGQKSEAYIEKLKAKLEDSEWQARATDAEFERALDELRYEELRVVDPDSPDFRVPTKKEVFDKWEHRTRRKREEIKTNRELKLAHLSELPQMRPGRPKGRRKNRGQRT
jgi:hypothetical protein